MYAVEVKGTHHRKWHRLSGRMRESRSSDAFMHARQYEIDNQLPYGTVAFALVDLDTGQRIEHKSNAQINFGV